MRALAIVAGILSMTAAYAAKAAAQTWSSPRGGPVLWQITSIDRSGEANWPYGREDVASDGAASFEPDEAGSDLRTVYADADPDRLWIRAYVAAQDAPPEAATFYFFIDSDDRDGTGGEAEDGALWPELDDDPTAGGYDRAIAARGDGTLAGAWEWDAQAGEWAAIGPPAPDVVVEVNSDLDPIRIGALERGYAQVSLDHDVSGLDASCDGNLFVRVFHDDSQRAFGDDDDEPAACRVPDDAFGDPAVLREPGCSDDDDCPADGRCRDGVCLFGYACGGDGDCRSGERCTAGVCVRVIERDCTRDADCDGLVCDDGECMACAESGARACESGLLCNPSGACLDPDDDTPGGGPGAAGAAAPGTTRGGAFECATAAAPGGARGGCSGAWLLAFTLGLAATATRMRRRTTRIPEGRRAGRAARWS